MLQDISRKPYISEKRHLGSLGISDDLHSFLLLCLWCSVTAKPHRSWRKKYQKDAEKVQDRDSRGYAEQVPREVQTNTPGDVEQSGESAEKCGRKVRKKYGNNQKSTKNMNTKGAGAEGARPLCGAAKGRPPCVCIFSTFFLHFLALKLHAPHFFCIYLTFFLHRLSPVYFFSAFFPYSRAGLRLHFFRIFSYIFGPPIEL